MFDSIQKELRKPAHYLSMQKREQAAKYIDKLEDTLNKYSEDEILLTHQSTIADQVNQIGALTQAIVGRDLILKQYMAAQPVQPSQARELSDAEIRRLCAAINAKGGQHD